MANSETVIVCEVCLKKRDGSGTILRKDKWKHSRDLCEECRGISIPELLKIK